MRKRADGFGFAGEAHLQVRVSGGQDLDGDHAVEAGVARSINLAHATRTEGGEDFVRTEASAGREGHAACRDQNVILSVGLV